MDQDASKIAYFAVVLCLIGMMAPRAQGGECRMNLLAKHYHDVFSYPDNQIIGDELSKCGGPLIDFGSATGRVLEIAAKCGSSAIGIDNSLDMITEGRRRLGNNSQIKFIHASVTEIQNELIGTAGLVTIAANTLSMFLESSDRINILKIARQYLKKSGRLFLYVRGDAASPQGNRVIQKQLETGEMINFKIQWNESRETMIRNFKLDFSDQSHSQQFNFPTKIIPMRDLLREFRDAGFEVEEQYGDFDKSPLRPDSLHWFFVLRPL